jgi:thioredoxin:protein disulfide reductase
MRIITRLMIVCLILVINLIWLTPSLATSLEPTSLTSLAIPDGIVLEPALREKLQQEQLSIYENTLNKNGAGTNKYKNIDMNNIDYALMLALEGNEMAATWAKEMLQTQMALLDPAWGGLYTYPSEGDALATHFEKKIETQAQAIAVYSKAYMLWHDATYLNAINKILNYTSTFLTNSDGAFYASQQAYSTSESQSVNYYQLNDTERRHQGIPAIDKHIYAYQNGYMIYALNFLYMATGDPIYLKKSLQSTNWIITHLSLPDGGFIHDKQNEHLFYLNDTLFMGQAFITLYKVTADYRYLERAMHAADFINSHFQSKTKYGFTSLSSYPDQQEIMNANENATLVRFTALLYQYTGNKVYADMANSAMRYLIQPGIIKQHAPDFILVTEMRMIEKPLKIVIVGQKNNASASKLYAAALKIPSFYTELAWLDKHEKWPELPDSNYPSLNKAAAYVCYDYHCSFPLFNPQDLTHIVMNFITHPTKLMKNIHTINKTNTTVTNVSATNAQKEIATLLTNKHALLILFGFWLLGFIIAFTPCVLPLLLMIVGILHGYRPGLSKRKIFLLTLTYVISLSLTYTLVGIIAAVFGLYIQAYMQNVWVLSAFSLLFILLSLSMLGFIQLKLPLHWRRWLIKHNNIRASSSYLGVAIMGIIAPLIASPCLAAPLIGILTYASQTGNFAFSGAILFATGLGMGTPLLVASTLLPNIKISSFANEWLFALKSFFGLLLMGIAIWLLNRVISNMWDTILWSALIIYTAIYMNTLRHTLQGNLANLWAMLTVMTLIYGVTVFVATLNNNNGLSFISMNQTENMPTAQGGIVFNVQFITNKQQLEDAFIIAKDWKKPVLLDFHAQWCSVCLKLDGNVFTNPKVNALMRQFILLRVDLSNPKSEGMDLAHEYNIIAPPAMLFFNSNGELLKTRVEGDVTADELEKILQQVLEANKAQIH